MNQPSYRRRLLAAALLTTASALPAFAQDAPPALPLASTPGAPAALALPHDLSPWGMSLTAAPAVQAVLIGLVFASLVTWTIWLAKTVELVVLRRKLRQAMAALAAARSLAEAERTAIDGGPVAELVRGAAIELGMSQGLPSEGVKERIASRLERIEAASGRRMARSTGFLATIGATAPFVGLFGTVWGIMNSFIGIAQSHTTNLAVVAPGIAEALLATAFGLVAAIPAVVIYNFFARMIAANRALLGDASAEILRLAGRDLDRQNRAFARAAE